MFCRFAVFFIDKNSAVHYIRYVRTIKRYSNRRLYDEQTSRTITQMDLADLVRQGTDIQVIDSASGEDITLEVLGRVVLSETSNWADVKKSKELYRQIIILGGDKSMSVLKNTVLASIGAIQVTKAKAEKIIDDLIQKGELNKSDRKKAVMELLDKAEQSTSQFREKLSKGADSAEKQFKKVIENLNFARSSDLEKLEKKVDQINKTLKAIEKKLSSM